MFYIYRTTNLINGKTYIGQHGFSLGKKDYYKGSGSLLKPAFKKYGIKNFKKDIIEVTLSQFEANVLEKYYIAKERAIGKAEYNLADGGQGSSGYHLSEKTKTKIREANKGKPKSEEHKKKLSEAHKEQIPWNKGVQCREETKKKIAESKKGRRQTEEEKRKQIEAQKGKHWYNNGKVNKFCYECPEGFVPGMLR